MDELFGLPIALVFEELIDIDKPEKEKQGEQPEKKDNGGRIEK